MPAADAATTEADASPRRGWRYVACTAAGLVCTAVAIAGAVLPGIPSVVPLLAAVYLLARGNPPLERRIRRIGVLQPIFRTMAPGRPFPTWARCTSMLMMWLSIGLSIWLTAGETHPAFPVTLFVAGLVGTVGIWRFRRAPAGPG